MKLVRQNYRMPLNKQGYTRTEVSNRVRTRPGKPEKMRMHLEDLGKSWNFVKFNTNTEEII